MFQIPVDGEENRNMSSTINQCSIFWNVTLYYSLIFIVVMKNFFIINFNEQVPLFLDLDNAN